MTFEIRPLELEEGIEILHFLNNYAFRPTPPLPDFEEYDERIRHRKGVKYFGLFENEGPMSICSSIEFCQNIRGRLIPMRGVANVATHPAARRRGYVRALMQHLYDQFQSKNIPVSCLYPFREAFYQRMGYVTLSQAKKIIFDPQSLAPTLTMVLDGEVELVPFRDGQDLYQSFLKSYQNQTHGMAVFALPQSYSGKALDYWLAVARQGDKIVGMMRYTLTGQIMDQKLTAPDFLYLNAQGKFLLLNWIARHIDQATEVELTLNPAIDGETLFTDIRPQFEGYFVPPMARIVCMDALNGIPCGEGQINIRVTDQNCPWNDGVWRLSSMDHRLEITASENGECSISIHGLTGLLYGAYSPDEVVARGWANINPQDQAILNNMFPRAISFIHAAY